MISCFGKSHRPIPAVDMSVPHLNRPDEIKNSRKSFPPVEFFQLGINIMSQLPVVTIGDDLSFVVASRLRAILKKCDSNPLEGVRFYYTNFIASGGWTISSHASLAGHWTAASERQKRLHDQLIA